MKSTKKWELIITLSILLLTITVDTVLFFKCIKIIHHSLVPIVFTVTITVSVLSLTLLSIILNSDYSVFGVSFKKYSKYENFPIDFKLFFIVTISLNVFAVFLLIFYMALTIVAIFVLILLWVGYYTYRYYDFLTKKETVADFLLMNLNFQQHGEEIENCMAEELSSMEDMLSSEAVYLKKHYKIIKQKRQEMREKHATR